MGGFAYHEVKSDVPTSPQGAPDEIGDLIRTLPKTDMAFPSMPVLADDGSRVDLKQSNFLQFGEAAEPLYGQVAFATAFPRNAIIAAIIRKRLCSIPKHLTISWKPISSPTR